MRRCALTESTAPGLLLRVELLSGYRPVTVRIGWWPTAAAAAHRPLDHVLACASVPASSSSCQITPAELAEVEAGSEAVNACDPVWKDLTDAEMAFEYALSQGVQEILMLGVTGTRLDHTLANLHLLAAAEQHGVQAVIIDPHNEIRLATSRQPLTIVPSGYRYVSLLPLTWQVTGITLAGFLYPLEDAVLTLGMTRGISNELIADRGTIELKSGQLLVIQSRD
mgnify:CR=1 FL=1